MEDAVILENGGNGLIVPLSKVSDKTIFDPFDPDMLFFSNGWVRRFKKAGKAYIALFDTDTNEFLGYFEEIKFWDNNKVSTDKKTTFVNRSDRGKRFQDVITFFEIPDDTRVYINHKFISKTDTNYSIAVNYGYKLKKESQPLTFELLASNGELEAQNISLNGSNKLITYADYVFDKQFLLPDGTLKPLDNAEDDVLFDIIYVFNEILGDSNLIAFLSGEKVNVYSVIEAHLDLPNRYAPPSNTVDYPYHLFYDAEYFSRFRLKLIEFRYWLLRYNQDYNTIDINDLMVYILNLFPAEELSFLNYDIKENLLKGLIHDNIWITGDWFFNALNEERAIVKITKAIAKRDNLNNISNYEDINKFLVLLNTTYNESSNVLFMILYNKIQDDTFFGDNGQGNKGLFVKAIYNMWLESKFNPYREDTTLTQEEVVEQALSYFDYTPNNGVSEVLDCIPKNPNQEYRCQHLVDENAAPMLLSYESERVLVWYRDNFNFFFKGKKIIALQEIKELGQRKVQVGSYDIFQPIALKATDANDTIIRMPVSGIEDVSNPTNINFIQNSIPIFYLKYVDDLGDYSDAKETIGTVVDVALTFSGIGNITKLRHITKLSLIRKSFTTAGLTLLEKQALVKAVSGTVSAVEALLGVASLAYGFVTGSCTIYYNNSQNPPNETDPEYQEYVFCQEVNKWLFALEMVALAGDFLSRRALKRATRKLNQSIPTSNEYDSFRRAVNNIDELDSLLVDFLSRIQSTHPNVHTKVSGFKKIENGVEVIDKDKQFAFMFDIEVKPSLLEDFKADPDLVDSWFEIVNELAQYRKEINYLRSYRRLTNNDFEVKHITDFTNGALSTGGFRPIGAHGGKNINNGVIRNPGLPAPPNKPPTTIYHIKNGHITYRNTYFIRPDGSLKKKSLQTIWNPNWSDDRIKAEMALAYMNRKLKMPTINTGVNIPGFSPPPQLVSVYKSSLSDGTEVEIKLVNFGKDPVSGEIKENFMNYFKLVLK